jgi:hypothetical protein
MRSPAMMMIWNLMRDAAIARHRYLNFMFEASCPIKWAAHMHGPGPATAIPDA